MAFNPYFFCDSPLPMELIQKALMELGELKPTVDELKAKVDKLIADLDGAIKEKVARVINEMYESGEFQEILERAAEDFLQNLPVNSDLNFSRIFRMNYNIGDNYRYQTLTVRPSHVQSGTYVESYGGIPYYIYCLVPNGVHTNGFNNAGVIVAINGETWKVAGQVAVQMNHMNAVDYNPLDECLYIAACLTYDINNSAREDGSPLLYRIPISEVVDVNKGGLNKNITDTARLQDASSYQPGGILTIDLSSLIGNTGYSNNVSYSNNLPANHIYVGSGYRVWEYSIFDGVVKELTNSSLNTMIHNLKVIYDWTDQTSCIMGDYMYTLVFNPSMIIRSNLTTNEIVYIYKLPELLDNGDFVMGEPEGIKVNENGDLYLFCNYDHFQTNWRQFRMTQIFKTNIFTNGVISAKSTYSAQPHTIYVDRLNPQYCPNGSASKPFNTIYEAISYVNTNDNHGVFNVEMMSNSNYAIEISTPKKVFIRRAPTTSEAGENHNKMSIGGINCSGCANVILENISVHMSYPSGHLPGGYLYMWQSNAVLNNIYFAYSSDLALTTAIYMRYCTGILTGQGEFTVENHKAVGDNGIEWTFGDFINQAVCSFNAHGWATVDGKGIFA